MTTPRIAVVGAGIAGLTTAAALARLGLPCRLFEQAGALREVGAGIQLSPNGTRLLRRLGLGPDLDRRAVRPRAIEVRRWEDGSPLAGTELVPGCEQLFGAAYYTLHRADLHSCLRRLVPDGAVRLGARCVEVREREDAVQLRFADGTVTEADLVIGADGIRSAVRAALGVERPRYSGHSVYRGLVPGDAFPALTARPSVCIWVGPGQHCVCYPISGGSQLAFAASVPGTRGHGESWSSPGDREDLLAAYAGWDPALRGLLARADGVTVWGLHDRPPPSRWSTGRVTLVGDAAHPMLPFGAQGAGLAVEDAVVLAACLAEARDVAQALQRYERLRAPRLAEVHRFTRDNERDHHVDDRAQPGRDARMRRDFGLGERAWLFGYDAELAAAPPA